MHVLLTNDDGVDAPGLAALQRAVTDLARVTVVAPAECYSGCGHRVTSDRPVRVEQLEEYRFKVFGTPADCTRLGLTQLAADVDLVLAGVNAGGNLGVDLTMSGTVAAVREACWLGVSGIAFSQYSLRNRRRDWEKATHMARRVFAELHSRPVGAREFWNVNFPDVELAADQIEIVDTEVEQAHLDVTYQRHDGSFTYDGDYRQRPRNKGSDVEVCFGGRIAVSRVSAGP